MWSGTIKLLKHRTTPKPNEPRHERTCLQGLQPGKTQTGLLS